MADADWLLAAATGLACLFFGLWRRRSYPGKRPAADRSVSAPAEGVSSAGALPQGEASGIRTEFADRGEEERLRQRVAWLEEWHARRTRMTEECLETLDRLCRAAERGARQIADPGELRQLMESVAKQLRTVGGDLKRSCSPLESIPRRVTDLPQELEALAAAVRHTSAVAVEVRIDPALRNCAAYRPDTRILQMVAEVLTNALRHSRASRIALRAGVVNQYLVISISDDGQGFDPLSLTPERQGGLGRMRAVIEAVRGHLQVETAAGAGTIVTLSLPLEGGERESAMTPPHSRLPRGETTPMTVQEVMVRGGGARDPGDSGNAGRPRRAESDPLPD